MAETINVHAAKTHLSRLLKRVAEGEEFIISRNGQPVARLAPEKPASKRKPVKYPGLTVPESFFGPLPDDELKAWEEGA